MIRLPFFILPFLPDKVANRQIYAIWDRKSDQQILHSFDDATGWIDLSMGIMASPTIDDIAQDCYGRLDKYILPQMKKRGLSYERIND